MVKHSCAWGRAKHRQDIPGKHVLNGRIRNEDAEWNEEMKLMATNAWWLQDEKPPDVEEFSSKVHLTESAR